MCVLNLLAVNRAWMQMMQYHTVLRFSCLAHALENSETRLICHVTHFIIIKSHYFYLDAQKLLLC